MWTRIKTWYRRWPGVCRWIPPIAWMGLIFVLSAQPDLPHAPGPLLDLLIKEVGHAVVYGVLFVLLWQALDRRFRPLVLAWMLAVLYAASDELHQTFVPGRNGRIVDVVIDGVGVTLAAAAVWGYGRRRGRSDLSRDP